MKFKKLSNLLVISFSAISDGAVLHSSTWCPQSSVDVAMKQAIKQSMAAAGMPNYGFPKGQNATGITCHGSRLCPTANNTALSNKLATFIATLPDCLWVENKKRIACVKTGGFVGLGGICVFFEKTKSGGFTTEIKSLARDIVDHGCDACGLVPIGYPWKNNLDDGYLKYGFVLNPCDEGLCPEVGGKSA